MKTVIIDITPHTNEVMETHATVIPVSYLLRRRIAGIIMIMLLSPALIAIGLVTALLIVTESGGGAFFIQLRPGKNGRLFRMVKFRTMYSDARTDFLTLSNDARVTKVGKWLRKFRLDELPQFWNVLKGDMSIIGPRPVPYNFYGEYLREIPNYDSRHAVRPGITGLAQVLQGYTNTREGECQKLMYDLHYIRNISFRMDLYILLHTIRSIFRHQPH